MRSPRGSARAITRSLWPVVRRKLDYLEAALASSAQVLSHAKDLWQGATLDQRGRLQAALFPQGLAHDGEKFRTAVTCLGVKQLDGNADPRNDVASPTGFEPVSQP